MSCTFWLLRKKKAVQKAKEAEKAVIAEKTAVEVEKPKKTTRKSGVKNDNGANTKS